ncbi:dihydroorotate dehydrogenase (quinone), mitochondrial-like [Schistocerca gregaria]|uniref:dihydroorotate dehydrogenase (quinone), mitochondrial-like n=1 Tax=Schistocerca gregaria TaxID=7010 RepID=UPI00211F0EE0|nr:dihydroorotate dehydrogenase (quinone), mitochondrial-like [Schistocerca gregaria]
MSRWLKSKTLAGIVGLGSLGSIATAYHYPSIVDFITSTLANKQVDPELAHQWFIRAAELNLLPNYRSGIFRAERRPELETCIWGKKLDSPVGLAAGLDKDARAMTSLLNLGFGFVEVGSVTPEPQEGNPKKRVFRLVDDRAVINRYGFNSDGHAAVKRRLSAWRVEFPKQGGARQHDVMLGINLGKNKTSDAERDYVQGIRELGEFADYLVVNVSSPNTPGLRDLQSAEDMNRLLTAIKNARNESPKTRDLPLLIKIAPDLSHQQQADIARIALEHNIDGLIVANTTVSRPESLSSADKHESGGLSGAPLKQLSLRVLEEMYKLTDGKIPLIGVGGIENGEDAYQKIRSGASLVQLYTAMTFNGAGLINRINQELAQCVRRDGYKNIQEAVGSKWK